MPIVKKTVRPRVFKNYKVVIPGASADGTDYAAHCSGVTLTPSSQIQTWQGASPEAKFSDATESTWTCTLAYAQDWTTEDSLSIFLLNHEGETFEDVEFWPLETGPKFTLDGLILVSGQIGGDVGQYGTATAQCGVVGKPDFTAGTPTPPEE